MLKVFLFNEFLKNLGEEERKNRMLLKLLFLEENFGSLGKIKNLGASPQCMNRKTIL